MARRGESESVRTAKPSIELQASLARYEVAGITSPIGRSFSPEGSRSRLSQERIGASVLVLALSFGCGGGTDGQPVTPPTAPAPEPNPVRSVRVKAWVASEPIHRGAYYYEGDRVVIVTRFDDEISIVDSPRLQINVGDDTRFAVFAPWPGDEWPPDRPQFQHQFVYEVAPGDRDEDGISIAADGIDLSEGVLHDRSGSAVTGEIYAVAAMRDSPDPVDPGEALDSHRVTATPEPRVCTDERERALTRDLAEGHAPLLVHEWTGEPLLFYWDASIPRDHREHAEAVFEVIERVSDAIEDQVGYSILEVGGWVDEADRGFGFTETNIFPCDGWNPRPGAPPAPRARPGRIIATIHPNVLPDARIAARPHCGVIYWDAEAAVDGTSVNAPVIAVHEIFHLFGFVHSPYAWWQSQSDQGIPQSRTLSSLRPSHPSYDRYIDLGGMTFDDIDALRCVFPANPLRPSEAGRLHAYG